MFFDNNQREKGRIVKIIKRGSQPEFQWQFNCRGCSSTLQADGTDVFLGLSGGNYGGESPGILYFVVCPVCQGHNYVPRDMLTERVRRDAKMRTRGKDID